jgi:hypothetical protein
LSEELFNGKVKKAYEIWDYYASEDVVVGLLGCNAV